MKTHGFLHSPAVVCLLQDAEVEVVQIKLALQCQLVESVQYVEAEGCPRSIEGRWIPITAYQLPEVRVSQVRVASTPLQFHQMQAIHINDGEGLVQRNRGRTLSLVMT